jgi:leucine dehydrogenase
MSWLERDFEHIEIARTAAGTLVAVAVHSTRLGPAFGGIRCWTYPTPELALEDVVRLAAAMTRKCAAAGVPGGGGKAVVVDRPGLDRAAAFELVGALVERLGGRFFTGPDVGTGAGDLAVVARATGFVARPADVGDLAEPTALGVFAGIEAVAQRLGLPLARATVAVQGLGAVGYRLAALLRRAGAAVLAADVDGARAARAERELCVRAVDAGEIVAMPCDILAPCALGGVLDAAAVGRLRARAVAGAANNVLASPEAGRALFARGILYAPDFVINAGALLQGALFHLEGATPPPARIAAIGLRVGEILDRARAQGVPPEVVAGRLAAERLAAGGGRGEGRTAAGSRPRPQASDERSEPWERSLPPSS